MNTAPRSIIAKLAILPLLALPVAACSSGGSFNNTQPAAKGSKASGGQLVIAQSADILTMDPAMHRKRTTQNVIHEVFESLVNQDDSLKPVPELATKWEKIDDLTWRFHLREGVTFQNGEPFDATDVKFSIDRILDPKQASPRASMLDVIKDVKVEDPHSILITTKNPAPTLLSSLAVNEIVPSDYVKKVGDKQFAAAPIGTGPFAFKSWVPNQAVTLTANKNYWGGAPSLSTIVFRPIPEVSSRMAALQSGDIQIAAEVPPDLSGQLTGQTKAVSVAGTRIFFLAMNLTKAPFNQQKVRVAANQAVDKQALVKALYTGHARALNQPAFPEMVGYSPDVKSYSFDPNAAASVLKGVNAPVVIDVTEADRMLAEAVSGQLEKAGLKASVNVLEDQAFDDSIQTGKSTAYLSSWGVAEGDADVILARHFWSPSRKDAFYTGYKNPELDKLIVAGRSTLDEQKRTALYAQAMQMIMNDAPWVPLLNPEEIYGVSSQVTGWKPSPIGRYNLAHVSLATH